MGIYSYIYIYLKGFTNYPLTTNSVNNLYNWSREYTDTGYLSSTRRSTTESAAPTSQQRYAPAVFSTRRPPVPWTPRHLVPGPTSESPLAGWLIRVQRLQMLELQLRLNTLLFSAFGNMPIQHPSPQIRSASQHHFGDLDAVPQDRGHPN